MYSILNKLKSLFTSIPPREKLECIEFANKFISFSVNKNLSDSISMNRVIQLEDENSDRIQYVLASENKSTLLKVYEKDRLVSFSTDEDESLNQLYTDKITELFDHSIKFSKSLLSEDSDITSDLSSEVKGLEWLKVSLIVLKSAINKSMEDPELTFDGQFFYGQRSCDEHVQMRIQCLSLDLLLEFLNDGRLRVTVWNYKDKAPDTMQEPAFLNEFVKVKQKVFDEFIVLLVLMSKASNKIKHL